MSAGEVPTCALRILRLCGSEAKIVVRFGALNGRKAVGFQSRERRADRCRWRIFDPCPGGTRSPQHGCQIVFAWCGDGRRWQPDGLGARRRRLQVTNPRFEDTVKALAIEPLQQVLLYDAIDRSPALVFVADDEMRYLAVNNTACEVLGYTRQELLSLRVTDVAVSPEADSLYQEMLSVRSQQGDVELRTKDGQLLPFVYEASEVTVGQVRHWMAVGFVNLRLFDKVNQLETALLSRVVIEQAKGIVAGRHQVDLPTAFEAIRSAARANDFVLKDLCRLVVERAETPPEVALRLRLPVAQSKEASLEQTGD